MVFEHLREAETFYIEHIFPHLGQPAGSTDQEIFRHADAANAKLCASHKEFLRWMGRHKGGVFQGSEIFTDQLLYNQELIRCLFHENSIHEFESKDVTCFFSHQGYVAAWYVNDQKSDPGFFYFYEVEESQNDRGFVIEEYDRLSDFFSREFDNWVKTRAINIAHQTELKGT